MFSSGAGGAGSRISKRLHLCYPFPGHPPRPRLHSRTWGVGVPPPGEIRVTGGSGYSLAAREEPGPSQPDTEHSGKLVSRSTPSPPWDPLPALEPRGRRTGRRRQSQGGPSSSRMRWARRGLGGFLRGWEGSQDSSALGVTSGKACRVTPDLEVVGWGDAGVFLSK